YGSPHETIRCGAGGVYTFVSGVLRLLALGRCGANVATAHHDDLRTTSNLTPTFCAGLHMSARDA
ncbi:MAG: hypothetical protein KJN97_13560, partial [Deltaproteobacteria bacterium]|nr:hypothetical protein [Deltaproteobacteria bacterium]